MKVVICGAGQVGANIARQLASEGNDVTVIDQSPDLIQKIGEELDVQAMVGHASHPEVLERAGVADADMLIAVTFSDEVNMVACEVGHALFEVPTKIARIRSQSYLRPEWSDLFSRSNLSIDHIISPEIEVARAIERRLQVPGAFDVLHFADERVRLVGTRLGDDCPVLNTPLRQLTGLFPDLRAIVCGIARGDRMMVPHGDDQLQAGDEIYFVADCEHVDRAMVIFGHEEKEARRLIIVGGGNIGLTLAQDLEDKYPGMRLQIIESSKARAETVSSLLDRAVVLHGDALDNAILTEAGAPSSETLIALTNDDEVNILTSLLAKRAGCQRAITLVSNPSYRPLLGSLGIDVAVNPHATTVSTILQHIRRGRIRAVHTIRDGLAEVLEAEVLETSPIVEKRVADIGLPDGVRMGAILRGNKFVLPRGETVIEAKDRVVLFMLREAVRRVEKMLAVRLEFF